jgi:hypothetical protein
MDVPISRAAKPDLISRGPISPGQMLGPVTDRQKGGPMPSSSALA